MAKMKVTEVMFCSTSRLLRATLFAHDGINWESVSKTISEPLLRKQWVTSQGFSPVLFIKCIEKIPRLFPLPLCYASAQLLVIE